MSDGIDFDYELNNGWDKWQNLVLTGMKEIKADNVAIRESVATVGTRVAVIESHVSSIAGQDDRIEALEANQDSQDALKRDRRWLVGILITVCGAVILPTLAIALSLGGF